MELNAKIYVSGHKGMAGSAIVRELERQGYCNIVVRTHQELDLTRQEAVEEFFMKRNQSMCFMLPEKWEVLLQMPRSWQILCTKI